MSTEQPRRGRKPKARQEDVLETSQAPETTDGVTTTHEDHDGPYRRVYTRRDDGVVVRSAYVDDEPEPVEHCVITRERAEAEGLDLPQGWFE